MTVSALFSLLLKHHQQRRDYHHLLKLDEHLLADIGLTREHIQRELSRPYWASLKLNLRCDQLLNQRHGALNPRH
ncbi:DUF1127 domain-containing protein [Halopseudomonas sp.]|uniref:DUF1127 domain-containing protein n=1 Tax=Halopseudomonas sp. TaxID=2901191 RepID=UPI0030018387